MGHLGLVCQCELVFFCSMKEGNVTNDIIHGDITHNVTIVHSKAKVLICHGKNLTEE